MNALRDRQVRNFLTTLFVSNGVPMLLAGDEFGRTQRGNNNAYCQDNEISWVDWKLDERRKSLLEFTRRLIRMRHDQPVLRRRRFFRGQHIWDSDLKDLAWFRPDGSEMTQEDWTQPFVRSLAFLLGGDAIATTDTRGNKVVGDSLLILMNANHEPVEFVLPAIEWGSDWEILVDTADGRRKDRRLHPRRRQAHRHGPGDDGAAPAGASHRWWQRRMSTPWWVWLLFNAGVLAVLAVDLGVARARGHRAQTAAEAGRWVLLWVALSLAFGGGLWWVRGHERGLEFFTAYVVEYALSVDNLFVFLLVFEYFQVRPGAQHLLLFWGVLGAFVLRGTLILGGAALVREFEWLLYLFGAFLLWTAYKLIRGGDDESQADPAHNPVMALARRVLPVADNAPEDRFVVRSGGEVPGHTPLPGAAGGGDDGSDVRPRLDSRGARREPRPLRALQQQRDRGARAPLAVLRPPLAPLPAATISSPRWRWCWGSWA